MRRLIVVATLVCAAAFAQDLKSSDPKERAKAARELGKSGSDAIAQLAPLLKDPVSDVRIEAVRAIVTIGTQHSIDPLVAATRDNEPEIQLRATDGLVNFYLPGYVQTGLSRLTSSVRSRFDRENTQIIDPYVTPRPEVITSLGRLAKGGVSMDVRANAARALGILRGSAAVPDLIEALQSRDDAVLFESLIALQKIRDQSAGPRVIFLLRDLHERVQIAAIDTVGLLQAKEAVPDLHRVYDGASSDRVRRSALTSLSMLANPASRPYFQRAISDKNDNVRASAAEGFARLRSSVDRPMLIQAFNTEKKMPPRLALAFALVLLGNSDTAELTPLTYLVNTLNSRSYRNVAEPYLIEAARDEAVRNALYSYLKNSTREEKSGLARVFAASGDRNSIPQIEWMTKDPDHEVAQEAIRAMRILQARLNATERRR
jgi:HEAT repeat protein